MQRLAKTKSPGVDVVTYDHRLAVQESDDENHVPTESDFFVVENLNHDDAIYWNLKTLMALSPHHNSKKRKNSFMRSKDWLKDNYPELFI